MTSGDYVRESSEFFGSRQEAAESREREAPGAQSPVRMAAPGATLDRRVYCILGLPFDAIDMAGTVAAVRDAAIRRTRLFLSTPNLNFLVNSQFDHELRETTRESDLSIADGMPIVWIARLLGIPITERVAGSSLIEAMKLRDPDNRPATKVYFFGGADGVAKTARDKINEDEQGLTCTGFQSPGFGTIEDMSTPEIIAEINESGADFVIVALGAKKGQAWISRNLDRLDAPVSSHLGAVVNFEAGSVKRAPVLFQRIGLEWLWRIKEEPALWQRYAKDGLAFARLFAFEVVPQAAMLKWLRMRHGTSTAPGLKVTLTGDGFELALDGAFVDSHLEELRGSAAHALEAGRSITLQMRNVKAVGPEFLGLVLVLRKLAHKLQINLKIVGVSQQLRATFNKNKLEDILDDR